MWQRIKAYLLYTWGGLHRYFGNHNNMPGEHERAIHYFTRAYEVNPAMSEARLARAVILWREMERMEDALADFDALLTDDPKCAPALLNRALIFQQTGNYEQALEDIQRYLALPPDDEFHDLALRMEPLLRELVKDEKHDA